MKLTIQYQAQARAAAECSREIVELGDPCRVGDLLSHLAGRHGEGLRRMILAADGRPHPSILLFVGDEQVRSDSGRLLREGDVVSVLSPIAGG